MEEILHHCQAEGKSDRRRMRASAEMQTRGCPSPVVVSEHLSDPLQHKSSQPATLQHCGLCSLPSSSFSPPMAASPPSVFSCSPGKEFLLLADGKLKLQNKYTQWKEGRSEGSKGRGLAVEKIVSSGNWERSNGVSLVWCRPPLSSSPPHLQLPVSRHRRCYCCR